MVSSHRRPMAMCQTPRRGNDSKNPATGRNGGDSMPRLAGPVAYGREEGPEVEDEVGGGACLFDAGGAKIDKPAAKQRPRLRPPTIRTQSLTVSRPLP